MQQEGYLVIVYHAMQPLAYRIVRQRETKRNSPEVQCYHYLGSATQNDRCDRVVPELRYVASCKGCDWQAAKVCLFSQS